MVVVQELTETHLFRLERFAYMRTTVKGWLLFGSFLLSALVSCLLAVRIFTSYAHNMVPYLKWQDALFALLCFIVLLSLIGCVLVVRFLYALHSGYEKSMVEVRDAALVVRDLSHENLSSVFWLVGTVLSCFIAIEVGLLPEMLLGWTLQIPVLSLAILGTIIAVLLSVVGLAVVLPAAAFVIIGLIGSVSFFRNLGLPRFYHLSNRANISIDGFVLMVTYPDAPESMLDLRILNESDRRKLLYILRERWNGAQQLWNPHFGEEIERTLKLLDSRV
jgi:MFS family permease